MMNNRNNNNNNKDKNPIKRFNKISIGLASPESILAESRGEVLKPETINYRTHKPERDGLFCERIFGPVKDFECACGKYKRIRYKGIVCDRCGVEVTEKKVRRDRVGHINLVVPIAHIWYFRSLPNKIGYILGLPSKKLDMIIYYERYVVIQAGIAQTAEGESVQRLDFLTEEEYLNILDTLPADNQYLDDFDPNKFVAKMGAECIMDLLARIDLDALSYDLRHSANNETSKQRKTEALKRLQVVDDLNDRKEMINTLYFTLISLIKLMAPAVPFFTEEIYSGLKSSNMPDSIHLLDWPKSDKKKINNVMEQASSNVPSPKLSLKNKYIKSAVILLTVFLFVGGLAYVWNQWLSPAAIEAWKYDLYQKYYVDRYEPW